MTRNDFIAQMVTIQRDFTATNRKAVLIRAFRMGDCILHVVEKKVYRTLSAACMEAADTLGTEGANLSNAHLQDMYRVAVAFPDCEPDSGRDLFLSKGVCWRDVRKLAQSSTEKRESIITAIRRHKAPTPFRLKAKPYKRAEPQPDNTRNPDCITIAIVKHGDIDEDAVLNVLKNILTRVGLSRAGRLWERAQREVQA